MGQSRTSQRRGPVAVGEAERVLRTRLQKLSAANPRWGWRKAHAIVRTEGLAVNGKRTPRLWREEASGARPGPARDVESARGEANDSKRGVQIRCGRRTFRPTSPSVAVRSGSANIIDEFIREALATWPFRSCMVDQMCVVLDDIITATGRTSTHIRTDNARRDDRVRDARLV